MDRREFIGAAAGLAGGLWAASAQAQFGGLGGIVGGALKAVPGDGLAKAFNGPQPISTSIADAVFGDPAKDGFTPPGAMRGLASLQRGGTGAFVLQQGWFGWTGQSYCLHAGTHGPTAGDGYLYAPIKGSAKDTVTAILQNSTRYPDIAQRDIQQLLWAIVARAKFEDLSNDLKIVAGRLLTARQLASLNRSALSVLTSSELSNLTGGLPAPLRAIAQVESQMRGMLTSPGIGYAELERVAVLTGRAPLGAGSQDIPAGRWSLHPDGYFVRYRPNGYTNTRVEVWVPQGSAGIGKQFDAGTQIAAPGNTARQRLAQSGREYGQ